MWFKERVALILLFWEKIEVRCKFLNILKGIQFLKKKVVGWQGFSLCTAAPTGFFLRMIRLGKKEKRRKGVLDTYKKA